MTLDPAATAIATEDVPDIVSDAIHALDAFNLRPGGQPRERVAALLAMWHRVNSMTVPQVRAVLEHYERRATS